MNNVAKRKEKRYNNKKGIDSKGVDAFGTFTAQKTDNEYP